MDAKNILKSLNMNEGEVLTLEKAKDRLEFEALPLMSGLDLSVAAPCRLYVDPECPELENM